MGKVQWFGVALGIAAGVATVWGACKSPVAPDGVLLTGSWGSDQGRLTGTQVSTQFTGACGSGSTSEPIMQDKHGHFDLVGLYGASGTAQSSAHFMGAVGSKTITLRVMKSDSTPALGPIVLHLGQQPALTSCH